MIIRENRKAFENLIESARRRCFGDLIDQKFRMSLCGYDIDRYSSQDIIDTVKEAIRVSRL